DEKYPKDKLAEIEKILADIAKKKAAEEAAMMAEKEKDEKYNAAIAAADNALNAKNYDEAKSKYNEALGVKPNEQYPQNKLNEIEAILADLANKKAAEEAAMMAEKEKDEKYNSIIALADKAFNEQSYETAKTKYNEALAVKPNEQHQSEEHTSELQSRENLVCRLLLEKKKKIKR